jgi:hypothetical protein
MDFTSTFHTATTASRLQPPALFSLSLSNAIQSQRFNLCTNKPSAITTGKQVLLFYLFPTSTLHRTSFPTTLVYLSYISYYRIGCGEERRVIRCLISAWDDDDYYADVLYPRAGAPRPSPRIPRPMCFCHDFSKRNHGINNKFLYQVSIAFTVSIITYSLPLFFFHFSFLRPPPPFPDSYAL